MARKQSIVDAAVSLPVPLPETEGPQCLAILYHRSSVTSKALGVKKGFESNSVKLLRKRIAEDAADDPRAAFLVPCLEVVEKGGRRALAQRGQNLPSLEALLVLLADTTERTAPATDASFAMPVRDPDTRTRLASSKAAYSSTPFTPPFTPPAERDMSLVNQVKCPLRST